MRVKLFSMGRHWGKRLSPLVLLVVMLPTAPSAASASGCRSGVGTKITNAAVCKGLAFYKGQTISFHTGTVGGSNDISARALAPLMQEYLGATVDIVNQTGSTNIPITDATAAAVPNGLTIGFIAATSVAADELTNTPGFNFNAGRLSWIVGEKGTVNVLVASPSSGITTFAQLKAVATPSETNVRVLASIATDKDDALQVFFGLLGMHVTWITGYANNSQIETGFIRGDGPLALDGFTNFEGVMQAKTAIPLAITSIPIPGTALRGLVVGTPTFSSLLKQYGPKNPTKDWEQAVAALNKFNGIGQPLVTQSKVPGYKVDALRAAVQWAWAQQSFISASLAAGNNPAYVNPVAAKAAYNSVLKAGTILTKYLNPVQ